MLIGTRFKIKSKRILTTLLSLLGLTLLTCIIFYGTNLTHTPLNILSVSNIILISFLCFLLLERFIYYFYFRIYKQLKYFILSYSIIALTLILSILISKINLLPEPFETIFLIPVTLPCITLAFLITPNISLVCGFITALLLSIKMGYNFPLFIFAFFSASVSTFSTYSVTKRSDLIFSGYIVGLFNGVFIIIYGLSSHITHPLWYGYNALLGFGAGVLASMISLSLIPYLESLFKITTNHTLLELSNLNHPLLKRLMATAPGTYQHSLMVASLAEAAGEKLKANSVLCRVGSYFHDIGKMKRPLFFTENQFSNENPHDAISDINSKAIIEAHVDDGVALAKKHKLPNVIIDIIAQHHGTSTISIFIDPNTNKPYRYKGPLPNSKEATIIMFADVVEATTRSKNEHNFEEIKKTISTIFADKIQDGQCNNSPLTLQEIDVIKETFLNIFKTMHHQRLDYSSVEAVSLDD